MNLETKDSAKVSMVSFAFVLPLKEALEVVEDLEELPLAEEEPPIIVMEPRLQSLPPLLLDLTGAATLESSSTMIARRGDTTGLEADVLEAITRMKKVVESKEQKK